MEQVKELSYSFNFLELRQLLLLECIKLYATYADKKSWRVSVEHAELNE